MANNRTARATYVDLVAALGALEFHTAPDDRFTRLVHDSTGTVILLPVRRPEEAVWEPNLASARRHVVENGIATAAEFDRLLAARKLAKAS